MSTAVSELPAGGRGETPAPVAVAAATAGAAQKQKGARKAFLILGGVAALVLAGAFGYRELTRGKENTDDAQVDADVVPLAPRVGGTAISVPVHDNQSVHKGDVLLQIDPADFDIKVKQSEAELAAAKAQAAVADAGVQIVEASSRGGLSSAEAALSSSSEMVRSADAQIAAAQAGLSRAKVDAAQAEVDLAREKSLNASGSSTEHALQDAQAKRDSAAAALRVAEAQLNVAEDSKRVASSRVGEQRGKVEQSRPIDAQIESAHASADLAHARVKSAEAALEQAKLQLTYTRILAPADGQVSRLAAHEGQLLSPGQPVLELVPATTYIVANFKETQVGVMKPGAVAEVEVDAYPGRKFEAKVQSMSGGTGARFSLLPPENATGNFVKVVQRVPVRLEWVNPPADAQLRAGLSADVTVRTE
jgi:membrane fusion protein, multidrug efflux system